MALSCLAASAHNLLAAAVQAAVRTELPHAEGGWLGGAVHVRGMRLWPSSGKHVDARRALLMIARSALCWYGVQRLRRTFAGSRERGCGAQNPSAPTAPHLCGGGT